MKYTGKPVERSVHSSLFVRNRIYDDRQIVYVARRYGLHVCRPNGDRRIRGSRRLNVVDPSKRQLIWQFTAFNEDAPSVVYPVPVARF